MKKIVDRIMKKSTDVDSRTILTEEEWDRIKEKEFYKLYPSGWYKSTLHNTHRKTYSEMMKK